MHNASPKLHFVYVAVVMTTNDMQLPSFPRPKIAPLPLHLLGMYMDTFSINMRQQTADKVSVFDALRAELCDKNMLWYQRVFLLQILITIYSSAHLNEI